MNTYDLPKSLKVAGKDYAIESDFRVIIDILIDMSDPELNEWEKQEIMFRIMYPDYQDIPPEAKLKACQKAVDFIDYNLPPGKPQPKTMDWEQDAPIIIPAVNKIAGMEVGLCHTCTGGHSWGISWKLEMDLYLRCGQSGRNEPEEKNWTSGKRNLNEAIQNW